MSLMYLDKRLCVLCGLVVMLCVHDGFAHDKANFEFNKKYVDHISYEESLLLKEIIKQSLWNKIYESDNDYDVVYRYANRQLSRGQAKELISEMVLHYKKMFEKLRTRVDQQSFLWKSFDDDYNAVNELQNKLTNKNYKDVDINTIIYLIKTVRGIDPKAVENMVNSNPRSNGSTLTSPAPNQEGVRERIPSDRLENEHISNDHRYSQAPKEINVDSKNGDGPSLQSKKEFEGQLYDAPVVKYQNPPLNVKNEKDVDGPSMRSPSVPLVATLNPALETQRQQVDVQNNAELEVKNEGPSEVVQSAVKSEAQVNATPHVIGLEDVWDEDRLAGPSKK